MAAPATPQRALGARPPVPGSPRAAEPSVPAQGAPALPTGAPPHLGDVVLAVNYLSFSPHHKPVRVAPAWPGVCLSSSLMEERHVSLAGMLESLWNSLLLPEHSGFQNPPALPHLCSFPSIPAALGAAFQNARMFRGHREPWAGAGAAAHGL